MQADFLCYLAEQVDALREKWSISEGQAFMMWYACDALQLDGDAAYEAVSYDGFNDKDIDFFYLDEEHERIVIAQGKFNRKGRYKGNKNELLGLIHSTDWLSNIEAISREGRPELVSAAEDYAEGLARGYTIEYQYVFVGPPNKDVTAQADLFNASALDELPTRHATVVNLNVLRSIHGEAIGIETRIASAGMPLSEGRYFVQEGSYGRALTATLPAAELCRLHSEHGDDLFARNVRLFLGTRAGGVNAGIRDTLASTSDRANFWAYNNGITIVCDNFKNDEQALQVTLTNFSVVNGCQTTVLLSNAGSAAEDVDVLVRFIAAPGRLIDNVIFYTNSQTPLRRWELRAQDKRQKQLQGEMAKEPNPYYYALRPGEVRTLTKEERSRYTRDGQFHGVRYDLLAQYLGAFRGLPYVAYKDKGKLFAVHYEDVFPPDLTVEEAILAWRAGEASEEHVERALLRAIRENDELETVILKRGGKLFTVSVMAQILSLRNGPNYVGKLNREVVTSKKTLERLATYAQVAVVWYVRATRQMVGTGGLQRLSSTLRTQDSYPHLRKAIDEDWRVQSIDKAWVKSLPKL
jgi:hypothetical protein